MPAEIGTVAFCACERCSLLAQINELCGVEIKIFQYVHQKRKLTFLVYGFLNFQPTFLVYGFWCPCLVAPAYDSCSGGAQWY